MGNPLTAPLLPLGEDSRHLLTIFRKGVVDGTNQRREVSKTKVLYS